MDSDHARDLLARERARVEHALAGHARTAPDDAFEAADTAPDLLDAEIDLSLADTLAAIERAEQRLADGGYGLSVESGAPIPDARLEAIPWAERTTEEQAHFDGMSR